MDDTLYYLTLNRQRGLQAELSAIANNVANIHTTGFRREGLMFSEFVHAGTAGQSVSMADLDAHFSSDLPGQERQTGGMLDLAIEGPGYFAVETPEGVLLTRAGAFQRSEAGLLVTPRGDAVLDEGQAPLQLPPEAARIEIARDGTVSADGAEIGRIGLFTAPQQALVRRGGTGFGLREGAEGEIAALTEPAMRQGALEGSNVDPVAELARMIAVSRAYEQAQDLIRDEDERVRDVIRTLGEPV